MLEKACPQGILHCRTRRSLAVGLADAECLGTMGVVVLGSMHVWLSYQPNNIGGLCVPGEKHSMCVHACACVVHVCGVVYVYVYMWACM